MGADRKEEAIEELEATVMTGLIEMRHVSRVDIETAQLLRDEIVRQLLRPENRWALKIIGETPV